MLGSTDIQLLHITNSPHLSYITSAVLLFTLPNVVC